MQKSLLELQNIEGKKLREEIKKIENAEDYYKLLLFFNDLAVVFFVMTICVIIIAAISEFMLMENYKIFNLIMIFGLSSLGFLLSSVFYKYKTLDLLHKHYEKEVN